MTNIEIRNNFIKIAQAFLNNRCAYNDYERHLAEEVTMSIQSVNKQYEEILEKNSSTELCDTTQSKIQ